MWNVQTFVLEGWSNTRESSICIVTWGHGPKRSMGITEHNIQWSSWLERGLQYLLMYSWSSPGLWRFVCWFHLVLFRSSKQGTIRMVILLFFIWTFQSYLWWREDTCSCQAHVQHRLCQRSHRYSCRWKQFWYRKLRDGTLVFHQELVNPVWIVSLVVLTVRY